MIHSSSVNHTKKKAEGRLSKKRGDVGVWVGEREKREESGVGAVKIITERVQG